MIQQILTLAPDGGNIKHIFGPIGKNVDNVCLYNVLLKSGAIEVSSNGDIKLTESGKMISSDIEHYLSTEDANNLANAIAEEMTKGDSMPDEPIF